MVTLVAVEYGQTLLVTRSALLDEMGSDASDDGARQGPSGRSRPPSARRAERAAADRHPHLHQPRPDGRGSDPRRDRLLLAGAGRALYQALSVPYLPLVQGLFFVFASAVIVMNTLADLIYPLLDPRVGR